MSSRPARPSPPAGVPWAGALALPTPMPAPAETLSLFNPNQPTMKTQTKPGSSTNQPIHKIRHGAISASIWRQETEKGPMFNVSFQRSYKDAEEWKSSTSFGAQNLLV